MCRHSTFGYRRLALNQDFNCGSLSFSPIASAAATTACCIVAFSRLRSYRLMWMKSTVALLVYRALQPRLTFLTKAVSSNLDPVVAQCTLFFY